MSQNLTRTILGVIALLGLWVVSSLVTYNVFVHGADHRDFYPLWAGTRLLLSGKQDIYSMESTQSIQMQLYNSLIPKDRDQQGFAYPVLLALFIFPFALIPDVEIATAFFQGFTLVAFTGCLLLLRPKTDKSSLFIMPLLILWQFPLLMIFQGQVTVYPFLAVTLAIYAFSRGKYFLAGVLLTPGLIKPEIIFIPLAAFMVVAFLHRRWQVVIGSFVSAMLLVFTSIILAGWWLPGWIQALLRYIQYAKSFWPIVETWKISPFLATGILSLIGFAIQRTYRKPFLFLSSSIPIGMLLLPQTLMWGLSMLILPLILSWQGKVKYFVLGIWAAGWLGLLFTDYNGWWKIQATVLPCLVLIAILLTSTLSPSKINTPFLTQTTL